MSDTINNCGLVRIYDTLLLTFTKHTFIPNEYRTFTVTGGMMGRKRLAATHLKGGSHTEHLNRNAINLSIDNTKVARLSPDI